MLERRRVRFGSRTASVSVGISWMARFTRASVMASISSTGAELPSSLSESMTTSAVASSLTRLARWRWARSARGLVGADAWGDTAQVDRLDQLYARSLREI